MIILHLTRAYRGYLIICSNIFIKTELRSNCPYYVLTVTKSWKFKYVSECNLLSEKIPTFWGPRMATYL